MADHPPLPWQQAGLTAPQAAAHMLNRFTFGPRPGEVEAVVEMGLRNWFEWQIAENLAEPDLEAHLQRLQTAALSSKTLSKRYPHHAYVVAKAVKEGAISRREYAGLAGETRRREAEAALEEFAREQGYRPQGELKGQLRAQKVYRAIFAEAQLRELLTEFWSNHFNISLRQAECRPYMLSFEREAIGENVFGSFHDLLVATARHPAMLLYLGNARSVADPLTTTTFDLAMEVFDDFSPTDDAVLQNRLAKAFRWRPRAERREIQQNARRFSGLNENYARELLELHTLGVQAGYTQDDVRQVARAFTGWTVLYDGRRNAKLRRLVTLAVDQDLGFVLDGSFLFRADQHDSEPKTVLSLSLPGGAGY